MTFQPHTIFQFAGGITSDVNLYIGPEREIVINTDGFSIHVQNGVTPGGIKFLPDSAYDAKYQKIVAELTQFINLIKSAPNKFLFAANGNLFSREFIFDANYFTVAATQNPSDPFEVSLLDIIPSLEVADFRSTTHTSTNVIATNAEIENLDVLNAALETAAIDQLAVENATGTFNGDFIGNGDFRTKEVLFDDNSIDYAKLKNVPTTLPRGVIVAWYGLDTEVPAGWAICNGNNGTPDLTDRCIIGAGGYYSVGNTDGELYPVVNYNTSTAGGHGHNVNVTPTSLTVDQMPAHTHANGVSDDNTQSATIFIRGDQPAPTTGRNIVTKGLSGNREGITESVGAGAAHTHANSTTTVEGAHSHFVSFNPPPNPPIMGLLYIMKL